MPTSRTFAVLCWMIAAAASAQTVDSFSGLASSNYITGLTEPTDLRWLPAPDGRMVITTKGGTFFIRQNNGTLTNAGTFTVDTES